MLPASPHRPLALLLAAFLWAGQAAAVQYAVDVRWSTVDDPRFAQPGYDDGGWERGAFWQLPESDGVLWARASFTLDAGDLVRGRPLGVSVGAMASHELYWDGELVGRGGAVGMTARAEVPGPIDSLYAVPDHLATPGPHVVAVRFSAHHRGWEPYTGYWYLGVGDYDRQLLTHRRSAEVALIGLSGILLMAVFAFVLWWLDRQERSSLLLTLLCVTAAALLLAESWRALFGYTYDWQIVRLRVVTALSWLLGLGLLAFLALRFPMRGRGWLVGAGVVGAALPIFWYRAWDPKALVGLLIAFSLALIWTLRAMRRRLPGAALASAGLGVSLALLLWFPGTFIDQNLYLALDGLFALLLGAHARQLVGAQREREAAEVRSARLEVELLKRQLQPHFLMNTLTALSEWLEEEPATAARMVHALADELRLLNEISDRQLIPLADELRLSRSHLEVMGLRTGARYRLDVVGEAGDVAVPPAMLHTLVENAVTHGDRPASEAGEVVLRLDLPNDSVGNGASGRLRMVFEAPLAPEETSEPHGRATEEGTGLRYIRARLRESFGEDWSLESGPVATSWRTTIEMPRVPTPVQR